MARDVEKGQLRVRKAQTAVNFAQRSRQFDTTPKQRNDAQKSYQFAADRLRKAQQDLNKAREKDKKKKVKEEGRIKLSELTPGEEAKKLGLKHKGWGKYADKSGKIVAKSEKGKLVRIKPTEKASKKSVRKKAAPVDAKTILAKKTGSQKGSNPGGFYKGADGQMRYVKFYRDPDQGKSEHLANSIYRALGLGAPKSHLFSAKDHEGFASDIIEGDTLEDIEYRDGIGPELANKILDGFAADILTGNWDAVGLEHDNILVDRDGTPHRIDNGGTFTFRAQAGKKPEHLLGKITEFRGLADPSINREYAEIFDKAGIRDPEDMGRRFRDQVERIVALRNKHGNWLNLINKAVPNWKGAKTAAKMLEARTKLLVSKAKEVDPRIAEQKYGAEVWDRNRRAEGELNGVPFGPWQPPENWSGVEGINEGLDEPPFPKLSPGQHAAAGLVIEEPDGRVWIVEPANHFAGYEHTFPKGSVEPGLTPQETAIKETWEESGLKGEIIEYIGDFPRTTSITRYYKARRTGGSPSEFGWETMAVKLVPKKHLKEFFNFESDAKIADKGAKNGNTN